MAFAKNGAAIIGQVVVPTAEVKILRALVSLGRPATVPEIATEMGDLMSDATLYSLLGRLAEQRRLVSRQVVEVELYGAKLRRVVWTAHQSATRAFEEAEFGSGEARPSRTAPKPAGATG